MSDALDLAVRRGREALRPPPAERCSEWAARRFRLAPESSAVAGRFDPWPHQRGLLDVMAADRVRVVTVRKSARAGYTKCLLAYLGWATAVRRRNTLVYLPTDADADEFAKDSVGPLLRDVPELEELLAKGSRNNKENTLRAKFFAGCAMHVRGGRTPNAYRRLAKDSVVYDEVDAFPLDVGGEGDPLALGDKRAADSPTPKSLRGSTPTTRGRSLLERSEQEADMRLAFRARCPRCGALEEIVFGGRDAPAGVRWDGDATADAHCLCPACGGRWDWRELPAALAGGRWEADDGRRVEDDGLRAPDGGPAEWPRHVALRLWAAYSPVTPWADIAAEREAAGDDADKLRVFTNTVLGDWWEETVSAAEPAPLLARREPYRRPPPDVRAVTFGADVQADRLEVEVVGWGAGEESWSIDYRVLRGDPTGRAVWDELQRVVAGAWTTADGRALRARCGVVDSGHLPDHVYQFSRRAGVRWALPGKGSSTPGAPAATLPRRPHRDHGVYIVLVGADTCKDVLFARLALEGSGPGRCHWPDRDAYDDEYFHQLVGEEKRPVHRRGRRTLAYVQTWPRVEALDCRVYAFAALRVALSQGWVDLDDGPAPAPPDESAAVRRRPRRDRWIR